MSEHDALKDAIRGMVERHEDDGEARHPSDSAIWGVLCDAGFPWVGIPEELGGAGGNRGDARLLWREVGRAGIAIPFVETSLAGWAAARAGLNVPPGALALIRGTSLHVQTPNSGAVVITGTAPSVPWADWSEHLLVLVFDDTSTTSDGIVAFVGRDEIEVKPGRNIAGEPRDDVVFHGVTVARDRFRTVSREDAESINLENAISRIQLLSGAADSALATAIRHAHDRVQFGRPIDKFQAVQQLLVQAAEQVLLLDTAARIFELEEQPALFDVAAAKVVANDAAEGVAAECHQVCGAMGMTAEFALQRWTRRLWAWAGEEGSSVIWRKRLARAALQLDGDQLWDMVTRGG
jgi:acyl-CoA dehydrogenase